MLLILVGCAGPGGSPRPLVPTSSAEPATTPGPQTPAPAVAFPEIRLFAGADTTRWVVAGLARNEGAGAILDLMIEVRLMDSQGLVLAHTIVPGMISAVDPGEVSPFLARFEVEAKPSSAQANLNGYSLDPSVAGPGPLVRVSLVREFTTADRQLGWLVRADNTGRDPIQVDEIAEVFRDGAGNLAGAASGVAGITAIPAGGHVTWLLLGEAVPARVSSDSFTSAKTLVEIPPSNVHLVGELIPGSTSQGTVFVSGELVNDSPDLRWARGVATLSADGQEWGLASIAPPVPLAPGGRLPFVLPGFAGVTVYPEDWAVSLELDPLTSSLATGSLQLLELEIDHIEVIGSSLFVRGRIRNSSVHDLEGPTVMGAVRSTSGDLWTAGWSTPQERIGRNDQLEFGFDLPWPAGFDLSQAEYDFRALALAP